MDWCFICPSPPIWPVFLSLTTRQRRSPKTDSCGTCLPHDADSYEYGKRPDHVFACRLRGLTISIAVRSLESGQGTPSTQLFPNQTDHSVMDKLHEHKKPALISVSRQNGRGPNEPSKRSHQGVALEVHQRPAGSGALPLYSDPPTWYRPEGRGHGCIVISHRESES